MKDKEGRMKNIIEGWMKTDKVRINIKPILDFWMKTQDQPLIISSKPALQYFR